MIAPVPEPEMTVDNTAVKEMTHDNVAVEKEDNWFGSGDDGNDTQAESIGGSDVLQTVVPVEEEFYFEVHYLDVGQADAALVLRDGEAMLIDGGNTNKRSDRSEVAPFLLCWE